MILEQSPVELELLTRAGQGCRVASTQLIQTYGHHVRRLAGRFFLPGAEREDLMQEGYSGLLTAIQTYDSRYGRSFLDYATMCIRNSLVRAVRGATRKKALMLTKAGELQEDMPLRSRQDKTEESAIARAMVTYLKKALPQKLSRLELDALTRRAVGASVDEICLINNVSGKQVENALFRARQKTRSLLQPWYQHGLGLPA